MRKHILSDYSEKKNVSMKERYCHSGDGETYAGDFNSLEECMEDAKFTYEGKEGCYIGTPEQIDIRWNSHEDIIIESIFENANDQFTDASDFISITDEQEVDLGKRIDETVKKWCKDNNITCQAYKVNDGHWVTF